MPQERRCPDVQRLQYLISYHRDIAEESVASNEAEQEALDKAHETAEALTWLKDFLLNRRNYQRKQQIKKQIMRRIINEHDLAGILDENIKATYGEDLERFSDNQEDEE